MKIGYCLSNVLMGGTQTTIIDLINEIKKIHQVKYCVLSMDAADPLIIDMLKGVEKASPEFILKWSDIIHLDDTSLKLHKKLFKSKWNQTIQFIGSIKKVNIFNKHLYSPNLVAVSDKTGQSLKQKHTIIYHGIDTDLFKPLPVEKKYDLVFLGRLRLVKNPGLFLEICEKGSFSFLIIGGTHRREWGRMNEFEKAARIQVKQGQDFVAGFVSHYDVPKYLNQARIGVVTSNSESMGLNILEPMACQVPVISRDVGDSEKIFTGPLTDLLIPYNAPAEAYVEKIKKYINNPELAAIVRNVVLDKFPFSEFITKHLKLYQEIYETNA